LFDDKNAGNNLLTVGFRSAELQDRLEFIFLGHDWSTGRDFNDHWLCLDGFVANTGGSAAAPADATHAASAAREQSQEHQHPGEDRHSDLHGAAVILRDPHDFCASLQGAFLSELLPVVYEALEELSGADFHSRGHIECERACSGGELLDTRLSKVRDDRVDMLFLLVVAAVVAAVGVLGFISDNGVVDKSGLNSGLSSLGRGKHGVNFGCQHLEQFSVAVAKGFLEKSGGTDVRELGRGASEAHGDFAGSA
jgi:hypothetical protein